MAAKKKTSKAGKMRKVTKKAVKKASATRELIAPRGDKRYVRRSKTGRLSESEDQGTGRRREARSQDTSQSGSGRQRRSEIVRPMKPVCLACVSFDVEAIVDDEPAEIGLFACFDCQDVFYLMPDARPRVRHLSISEFYMEPNVTSA